MRNKIFLFFVFLLCICTAVFADESGRQWPEVEFTAQDRILILAPHPDDEILGCAGIIQKARAHNLPIKIVFFTYGDNNEWSFILYRKHPVFVSKAVQGMGMVRHDEAIAAAKEMGLPPEDLIFLGYPDFGTINIWLWHWADAPAFRSMLTQVTAVPYANAFRPGALYKGEEVLKDLRAVFSQFRPTKIFLSHPGDHNGDHRALYLFTRVALWMLDNEMQPQLYPYLVHFKGWPLPRGYHPDRILKPPEFFKEEVNWKAAYLNLQQIEQKERALKAHKSQYKSSAKYMASFLGRNELFGDFSVVRLVPNTLPVFFTSEHEQSHLTTQEELTDTQRAGFLGIEKRYIQLENGSIVLSTKFSRPLVQSLGITVYIFGYRNDKPFGNMPKIRVRLGIAGHRVYDGERALPVDSIRVISRAKEITMYIPLEVLGNPQRILTSATSFVADVPVDWVSWQTFEFAFAKK
jgi:LmbE family N-acetylglucosaminyl deacetylase